jgi:uncharacterized protein
MPSILLNYHPLYEHLKSRYAGGMHSLHGPDHWIRVARNGLYLSDTTGADQDVVVLFALLHDSQRLDDGSDPDHGPRAAEMAAEYRGEYFDLADDAFALLQYACRWHTHQDFSDNVTIGTCWDADRLDLSRVGITPLPYYMNTELAKRIARHGSIEEYIPFAKDDYDY